MNVVERDLFLMHYGQPMRSGRYPYGSGKDPYQHGSDFLARVDELKKKGLSDVEIAQGMGLTTTKLRIQKSLAKEEKRALDVATAQGLRDKGYSLNQIADKMGYNNDSSVRSLLNTNKDAKKNESKETVDFLRKQIDEKGMIDVGVGVERELNISKERLNQALYVLELEGYPTYGGGVPQVTNPGRQTNIKVIGPPGTQHKDIYDFEKVSSIRDYTSHDDGKHFDKFQYPKSIDSKRVSIRYAEDGGIDKDGVVEIRRNVDDLSLGNSRYAQVRILVDNNKYIKGMAHYSDDLPDGVDIVFNTNKSKSVPKDKVLKPITDDPDNPFGSLIKTNGQSYYTDKDGNRQLSAINKRAEEGDWGDWKDKLPSQFLGKQSLSLIKKQVDLSVADKKAELDEILSLTNPTVKKAMLQTFSDDLDSAAVYLQAASLPRQKYQVILPVTTLKDTEVYAPNYKNGEKVALVRYPHGGTFEIPILTVNNKHKDASNILGNALDAVGINSKVAERLSGADFDGDTVMVIPTNSKVKITSTPPLKELEGFDPKMQYGGKEAGTFKPMNNTQTEMGKISNLITDMTLKGATQDELARAVKHSMVVIDAEKHKLDYKASENDNNIKALKQKYQGRVENDTYKEGASTLLSRAKSEVTVVKRKGSPIIDPKTGEVSYKEDPTTYVDSKGRTKNRTQSSTLMAETKDAKLLSSGTPQEEVYVYYANTMKTLANTARKEMLSTGKLEYSSTAAKTYATEVSSLDKKLDLALSNAPKERQAQLIANSIVSDKRKAYPDLTKAEIKKISQQALDTARTNVGAKREPIKITDSEWNAIQAGAISENKLTQIINNTDIDSLRSKATPRTSSSLSTAKINKIQSMQNSGYTTAEIADALGVSTSVIRKELA